MDRHQFGAVRERGFNLYVVDHLGNAVHDLIAGEDMGTGFHEFGNGAAIARAFDDEIGNEGDGLGMVELDATLEPATCHIGSHRNQKLVLLARGEIHADNPLEMPETGKVPRAGEFGKQRRDEAAQRMSVLGESPDDKPLADDAETDAGVRMHL